MYPNLFFWDHSRIAIYCHLAGHQENASNREYKTPLRKYSTLYIWFNWEGGGIISLNDHRFRWSIQYEICIEPGDSAENTRQNWGTSSLLSTHQPPQGDSPLASWPPLISLMFFPSVASPPPSSNVLQFFLLFCFQSIIQDKTAHFGNLGWIQMFRVRKQTT